MDEAPRFGRNLLRVCDLAHLISVTEIILENQRFEDCRSEPHVSPVRKSPTGVIEITAKAGPDK